MKKITCIYKIISIIDDKIYVGSALNFNGRKSRHLSCLRRNIHHSRYLQNSFNLHGENNFIFDVLELVEDQSKLIETEQKWIDWLKPDFNMTKIAGFNSSIGMKRTDETKRKISESLKGKKQSPEHIEANRLGHIGLKQSEETKKKRSEVCKNSVKFQEAVKSKVRNNKIYETRIKNGGYFISDDQKKKISETLKSKNLQSAISVVIHKYDLDGNLMDVYPSMMKAEIANGYGRGLLYYNLVKQKKTIYKGLIWKIIR